MAPPLLSLGVINVGDQFPEFDLVGSFRGDIGSFSLSELTDGAGLLVNVYAYDYQPICESQVCSVDDMEWLTLTEGLNVVGVNGDGPCAHRRFAEENALDYPLLSDTDHSLLHEIGVVYDEIDGLREVPVRSVFLVDQTGTVRYRWVAANNTDPWTTDPIRELREVADGLEAVA
jgi:Peroxiredoxin